MLAEQLHSIDIQPAAILLEPEAKNTAPAIGRNPPIDQSGQGQAGVD